MLWDLELVEARCQNKNAFCGVPFSSLVVLLFCYKQNLTWFFRFELLFLTQRPSCWQVRSPINVSTVLRRFICRVTISTMCATTQERSHIIVIHVARHSVTPTTWMNIRTSTLGIDRTGELDNFPSGFNVERGCKSHILKHSCILSWS